MRTCSTLLILSTLFVSCSKSDAVTPDSLTGAWVEKDARQDTLLFNLDRSGNPLLNTILINRGKVPNASGYLVPKIGSGLWSYQLNPDSITVGSLLSSSSRRSAYVFRRESDQLRVGNFFELGFNQPATAIRTFVRL